MVDDEYRRLIELIQLSKIREEAYNKDEENDFWDLKADYSYPKCKPEPAPFKSPTGDSKLDYDVALLVIKALKDGTPLDELLKNEPKVARWYKHLATLEKAAEKQRQVEAARLEKRRLAEEKQRLINETKAQAAAKLTDEERAAFGLTENGIKIDKALVKAKSAPIRYKRRYRR